MKKLEGKHRYNLVLPEERFQELRLIARKQNVTVAELIRKCITIGLLVFKAQDEGKELILKGDADVQKITFV